MHRNAENLYFGQEIAMVPILEEMSEFFNNRAEVYNVVHVENIDGGIESKRIIASFLPDHTKTIIDFGIGTGLELEEIFRRFPDIEVTGLDIAENMLQLLKESYPDKNICLHCESYLNYEFGNCCYDAALSVMTLHHYDHETKTNLYRKIHDCIKQNGIYIECDYMLSEQEYENAQEQEDLYFSEYKRLKDEQGINDNREYHYDTPCTVANQKKMLTDAGFTNVREVWHRKNTVIIIADK
jgi:tRNA (cmo5U34)-methyltransferase